MLQLYRRDNKVLVQAVQLQAGSMVEIATMVEELAKLKRTFADKPATTLHFQRGRLTLTISNEEGQQWDGRNGDWLVRNEYGDITIVGELDFNQNYFPHNMKGH